jgi:hypothetical protein
MRQLFLFILLFTGCRYEAFCQRSDSSTIYLTSLTTHLEYLKSVSKKNLELVYVEKSDITTENLPEQIDGTRVHYLTGSEIQDKTRKGERIKLIVIRPVVVKGSALRVVVIDFSVTSKKNNFNYANGGGSTFEFTYNCDVQRFELTNKKQGGI